MKSAAEMRYFSLCSGIEAATVAWAPLGWRPLAFAEIDPFCCALLQNRFPEVPNLGDITRINGKEAVSRCGMPDVLVAGTPCQSFSVAGRRLGLDDPRGNVTLHFLRLAGEIRPQWIVWENVPGVLSIDGGETFRQIVAALDEFGYGLAWRVLDAQYFGVPQRRRRVFLVGRLGDWRGPAEVLLDPEGGPRDPHPGCEAPENDTGAGEIGSGVGGGERRIASTLEANYHRRHSGSDFLNLVACRCPVGPVSHKWHKGAGGPSGDECQNLVAFSVRTAQTSANGIGVQEDAAHCLDGAHGQAVVFETRFVRNGRGAPEETCPPLKAQNGRSGKGDGAPVVVFTSAGVDGRRPMPVSRLAHALTLQEAKSGDQSQRIVSGWHVRRFTPRECERLQGFPDDWTLIEWRGKPASDTQRYKAIGNSMAVPVVRWIGSRIMEAANAGGIRAAGGSQ